MTLSGPPPPHIVYPARTPSQRADARRFWLALWTPAIAVLGTISVALIGIVPSCLAMRADTEATRRDVAEVRRAVEATRTDVREARDHAGAAEVKAAEAHAKARENAERIDGHDERIRAIERRTD